jgi:CheY-like chemotaxis protein
MVTSEALIQELATLRRYARALTGSQDLGDSLVVRTLENLSEDPAMLGATHGINVALFRALTGEWNKAAETGEVTDLLVLSDSQGVDRSIALITPRVRQAFLLSALEGLSTDHVAVILDTTVDQVTALIEQARAEIAAQTSTTVLIIEDELFIATQLEHVVRELGHAVLGIARTRSETNKTIDSLAQNLIQPGLVLADIQLADGSSGIDAVNDLLTKAVTPVIFVTAFPERLLTGRSVEPTFLLNKPFSVDALKAMITQVLFFRHKTVAV